MVLFVLSWMGGGDVKLMAAVGVSMALGAFLAGVVLAGSGAASNSISPMYPPVSVELIGGDAALA